VRQWRCTIPKYAERESGRVCAVDKVMAIGAWHWWQEFALNKPKACSKLRKSALRADTLMDTFFTNKKNDVSALIKNTLVVLTEHQSTINKNMPFRFLVPVVRLFENGIRTRAEIT
jgi:hypothetical protein